MTEGNMTDDDLRHYIAAREWYHTIEIRPGVLTPGWFDTSKVEALLPWPDLRGKRCLDIGTFDGFWALAMEARGAAEVVAIDVLDPRQWDWPPDHQESVIEAIGQRKREGDGFLLVTRERGSRIKRLELNVYDLDPTSLGQFDFVYFGSLLLHLRDPIKALIKAREVLAEAGSMIVVDAIDLEMSLRHPRAPVARLDGQGRPWWWRPNLAALRRMAESAGLHVQQGPHRFFMPAGPGRPRASVGNWRALKTANGRQDLLEGSLGDPHAWMRLGRPE